MVITGVENRVLKVLSFLSVPLKCEIEHFLGCRLAGAGEVREIRVRAGGACSIILKNERIPLASRISREELEVILYKLCEGSVYAFRDSIASGYIPLSDGVRVGICGLARYENGQVVGISEAGSLVFRIPGHECDFADELFCVWESGIGSGMLIYSPPGVGKTTALRALVRRIGSGRDPRKVAVIDERCEFISTDLEGCEVDLLRGYGKRRGIEIAARTLSPQLLVVDEIGDEDCEALAGVVGCGIPLIATAHGATVEELYSRPPLRRLIENGFFDVFVGISYTGGAYSLSVSER